MKKRVISIIGLVIIVILISYGLTIFEIKSKIIWGLLFVALTYLICAMTNKFLKPNTILYALLTGIVFICIINRYRCYTYPMVDKSSYQL